MLFFKKKKERKPEKAPIWFMWMLGGFVAYAILTNLLSDKVTEVQKAAKKQEESQQKIIDFSKVEANKSWRQEPLPFSREDIKVGKGVDAACWATAVLRYAAYLKDGKEIENNLDAPYPLRITIGKGEMPPAFERGVMGMRVGGERHVASQAQYAFDAPEFARPDVPKGSLVGFKLFLEGLEAPENMPTSFFGLRIYDDAKGAGKVAQCTELVYAHVTVWDISGKEIWRSVDQNKGNPVAIYVGAGRAPYAVEQTIIGMQEGGKRTSIVPIGYMQPLNKRQEKELYGPPTKKQADIQNAKRLPSAFDTLIAPEDTMVLLQVELVSGEVAANLPVKH